MRLSDGEKLILVMLSDVYEKLGIEGDIDPKFVKRAIEGGHSWGLKWEYPGIFDNSSDESSAAVEEVADILTMWCVVEQAHDALSDADKQKIKEAVPYSRTFYGFDGNNEIEHMSIARFLIHELGRFGELKGQELNSHRQALPHYQRMLKKFELIRKEEDYRALGVDQLIEIIKAGYE